MLLRCAQPDLWRKSGLLVVHRYAIAFVGEIPLAQRMTIARTVEPIRTSNSRCSDYFGSTCNPVAHCR